MRIVSLSCLSLSLFLLTLLSRRSSFVSFLLGVQRGALCANLESTRVTGHLPVSAAVLTPLPPATTPPTYYAAATFCACEHDHEFPQAPGIMLLCKLLGAQCLPSLLPRPQYDLNSVSGVKKCALC